MWKEGFGVVKEIGVGAHELEHATMHIFSCYTCCHSPWCCCLFHLPTPSTFTIVSLHSLFVAIEYRLITFVVSLSIHAIVL